MFASFLFVGLDANYDANIEETLPEIFKYLDNGVNWWQRNPWGVHHPFRLPGFNGDGKRYHDKFAEIGFTQADAQRVSFVELLHLPTTGQSALTRKGLSGAHLLRLNTIFNMGAAQYIFVSRKVTHLMRQIMRQTGMFAGLNPDPLPKDGDLKILRQIGGKTIYEMYHLSCYGWQLLTLDKQIAQIRRM